MNTTHTPGPWTHIPRARDGHADKIAATNGAEFISVGSPVAEYPILDAPHENTQTANARLIATAPELLAALQSLFEHCAMTHKHWGEGCNQKQADAAIAAGCAAIAKATGEQP